MKFDWSDKTVLVTGAGGFIGSNLIKRLVSLKASVIGIDDFSFGNKDNIPSHVPYHMVDVSNKDALEESLKGINKIDYIFHFGAPCTVRMFETDPVGSVQKTIVGFTNIVGVAKRFNSFLIYPSSGNVYGNTSKNVETEIPKPTNLYGVSKYITEHIASISNICSLGYRIFAGYGPGEEHKGEYACVVTIFANKLLKGEEIEIWGDGSQTRDFIYITDIVDALIKGAELRPDCEIINLGSGMSMSFKDLIKILANFLNVDYKVQYVKKPSSYVEKTEADLERFTDVFGYIPGPTFQRLKEYCDYLKTKD